ncbi:LysM peptidoglycan-binding domain-containing protein [Galbitalea soli]|uniref:LysM peptidoglycan-binding domain-containing protein n=1 Tax=Galbitalea soli TaxID=1268042 RepID=A0A7C9PL78_9MICO|nr:LysM peptidoglycan-binding domain-containing protein [Galbitalea soli]NEM89887.1 LysM peptidoglycan-binding domain-containing protein [Galbitalea soli]NYJ30591.1 hypothetical protein [Galbitalea soli]
MTAMTFTQRPAARSRLRLTRRGRVVLTLLVATPFVVWALVSGINAGGAIATSSAATAPLQTVTVSPGETLWHLASVIAPTADPRDFVDDVIDLNQLDSATLQPGQSLEIPAAYSH